MAMEKRAKTGETDIRGLIKKAEHEEAVVVGNYDEMNDGKDTIVLIATGPRAKELRDLLKQGGVI